jgi:hypothetical protein
MVAIRIRGSKTQLSDRVEQSAKPRALGMLKGKTWISRDFDAPLPDGLLDLFEGKTNPKPKARKR